MTINNLRLKILDKGTCAFSDEELQAFLDNSKGNMMLAAAAALDALAVDEVKLDRWIGLTAHDANRLQAKEDILSVAKNYRRDAEADLDAQR